MWGPIHPCASSAYSTADGAHVPGAAVVVFHEGCGCSSFPPLPRGSLFCDAVGLKGGDSSADGMSPGLGILSESLPVDRVDVAILESTF